MGRRLRTVFLSGLLVIAPLAVTAYVLVAAFRWLDGLLGQYLVPLLPYPLPGMGILATLLLVLAAGLLVTNLLGRRLWQSVESLISRTPVAGSLYQTLQQFLEALLHSGQGAFHRVALIEYPRPGCFTLAFVTGESNDAIRAAAGGDVVHVFVPTVPNPTSGFFLAVPREQVRLLDMPVEQGFRLILSAGAVASPRRNGAGT
ncbi:MAG: DUF502 domain-containing protein [Clostridia bacterium]|nr:DUF502 domain-containing protein [Clostridia bacterium]